MNRLKTKQLKTNFDIFELDLLTLDKHWLEQPLLVAEYGIMLADAKDAHDRSKAQLDVTRAEVEAKIITNPKKYKLEKVTVSAINAKVALNKKVLADQRTMQKKKHRVDVLQATMNSLEHRKRALEGLVSLHGQQYFAPPQATTEGHLALDDMTIEHTKKRIAKNAKANGKRKRSKG